MTGALLGSCTAANTVKNTGIECNKSMGPTAAIVMVPVKDSWLASDEANFTQFLIGRLHAAPSQRWYILFGALAPIRTITNSKESDVTQTFDDGSMALVRKGMYNRTFMTDNGGSCFAKALASFDRTFYAFIEIDSSNQVKRMQNTDGTFSGFPLNLAYAPTPELADFKSVYMNSFMMSFNPLYYINKGSMAQSEDDITSINGLLDVSVTDAGGSSATKLKVSVMTECGASDLIALFGITLAALGNFIVTDAATKAVVVPTAIAIVSGHIELTGVFTSGHSYIVGLSAASVLLAADIEGYEGIDSATILIP